MAKLIAILNVVVWSGFWAFGYLALTATHDSQMMIALVLAAVGAGCGVITWMWLVRHSEDIGYAERPKRGRQTDDEVSL